MLSRRWLPTTLCSITYQKITIHIFTTVETSNLMGKFQKQNRISEKARMKAKDSTSMRHVYVFMKAAG